MSRPTLALLIASPVLLLAGCDTIASDFGDFARSFTPPSPAQAAEWALDPYDTENRRRGTTLLANAPWGGSDVYLRMYRDRIENETDAQVLAISIRALARHGTPEDAPPIARHLGHPSAEVRWETARALTRLHNPAVVEALVRALVDADEDSDVRGVAADALGQYPQDRSFQALALALDARELEVNERARASLMLLTGVDEGGDRRAWIAWYAGQPAPFARQKPYIYPTYSRRLGTLDYLAFWNLPQWEIPSVPAGARDERAQTTYGEPPPRDAPAR